MADVNVTPATTLLTEMQTTAFQATDSAGVSLPVTWAIKPEVGTIGPASTAGGVSALAKYTAPQQVSSAQTVTVLATSAAGKLGSATVFLIPISVEITPLAVDLKPGESQQFNATVAGDTGNDVTWNISPEIGTMANGLYTAPSSVPDSATVNVIARSAVGNQKGRATVTLVSPPWTGRGRNALGIYLLAVFSVVFLVVALWPAPVPDLATARADRIEANKNAEDKAAVLKKAQDALDSVTQAANAAQTQGDKDVANGKLAGANAAVEKAQQEKKDADSDFAQKRAVETKAADTHVDTWLGSQSRDTDLMLLVLLGGVVGSFLHSARSFADFVGNRQIKGSWAWWYFLHPFMGAALALIFYMAVRGGFLAITGGASKTSDLNPYGVTSIAALVGMFSKQATLKLADVFETLFKSDKSKDTKDQLHPTTQAPGGTLQPSNSGSATTPTDQTKKS